MFMEFLSAQTKKYIFTNVGMVKKLHDPDLSKQLQKNKNRKLIKRSPNENFSTIANNLAIRLANLPLSIGVQTMLLLSMYQAMPFSARTLKKHLL